MSSLVSASTLRSEGSAFLVDRRSVGGCVGVVGGGRSVVVVVVVFFAVFVSLVVPVGPSEVVRGGGDV